MEYKDNHDSVRELLDGLEEGDRVHIEADSAVPQDPESSDGREGSFERGDRVLIDDDATVVEEREADPMGVLVELDGKRIKDSEGWATNELYMNGGEIIANWKDIRDEDKKEEPSESEPPTVPVNYQVAVLNRIELLE
jgi:hypothetical protein